MNKNIDSPEIRTSVKWFRRARRVLLALIFLSIPAIQLFMYVWAENVVIGALFVFAYFLLGAAIQYRLMKMPCPRCGSLLFGPPKRRGFMGRSPTSFPGLEKCPQCGLNLYDR